MIQQILHPNGVYQHIRQECVIYKRLAWVSVVIIILWKGLAKPHERIMVQQHLRLSCIRSVYS
ncbi:MULTISPECIES: hypothetical protein [Bacteroides]|uniref:hypothetical protein n=1 Tax=Bacteroides TaxID=816 RepID=UPI000A454D97|nr:MULTISPECIES: hypothetical protein [Bacteroides]MBT9876564.1 hypothetical protein [Bacteroides ovatus]UYI74946.1 MAG: hypothetical protein OGM07_01485 [Bacteroides xylanisolvens]